MHAACVHAVAAINAKATNEIILNHLHHLIKLSGATLRRLTYFQSGIDALPMAEASNKKLTGPVNLTLRRLEYLEVSCWFRFRHQVFYRFNYGRVSMQSALGIDEIA